MKALTLVVPLFLLLPACRSTESAEDADIQVQSEDVLMPAEAARWAEVEITPANADQAYTELVSEIELDESDGG